MPDTMMSQANEQYVHDPSAPHTTQAHVASGEDLHLDLGSTDENGTFTLNATEMLAADEAKESREWYWKEGVRGEGAAPDYFDPDKFPTVEDQAKAASGLRKALSQKGEGTNTEVPDQYAISLNDDLAEQIEINPEDPMLADFSETAKNIGLSQDQFGAILNNFYSGALKAEAALSEQQEVYEAEQKAEYIKSEKEKLGPNVDERVSNLKNWITSNFDERKSAALMNSVTSAELLEAFEALRHKNNSVPIPGRNMEPATSYTHDEAQRMLADPRFGKDSRYTSKVTEYYSHLPPSQG